MVIFLKKAWTGIFSFSTGILPGTVLSAGAAERQQECYIVFFKVKIFALKNIW
jgi:hypothetical protein